VCSPFSYIGGRRADTEEVTEEDSRRALAGEPGALPALSHILGGGVLEPDAQAPVSTL